MKSIIITKGNNADAFIPADARATIKIDKLQPATMADGEVISDLFTVMQFDEGIEPFIRLRDWHLGEVLDMETILGWAKLTKVKVDIMDGDSEEVLFDPDEYTPEKYNLSITVNKANETESPVDYKFKVAKTDIQGIAQGDADDFTVTVKAGESTGTHSAQILDDENLYNVTAPDGLTPEQVDGMAVSKDVFLTFK